MVLRSSVVVAVLLFGGDVFAQSAVPPEGLHVKALPAAVVHGKNGVETRGKLLAIDDASVVLLVEGAQRRFELSQVTQVIRSGDSLRNGAIIGAVIGFTLGLLNASLIAEDAGHGAAIVGFSTGVYAGIGACIDALAGRRMVLYDAPGAAKGLSPGGAIALRFTW